MYLYSSSSNSTSTTFLHKHNNRHNTLSTAYINYITKSLYKTQPKMTDPTPPQQQPATPTTSTTTTAEDQQKKEALAAFTATLHSVGTNLETPLRDRAATITANAAALEKQERELAESTARLARSNQQWGGIAEETREGLKEIGDVQNWAEMIERDLLVLEEMMDGVEKGEREREVEVENEGEVEAQEGRDGSRNGDMNGKKKDAGSSERQGGWLRWW